MGKHEDNAVKLATDLTYAGMQDKDFLIPFYKTMQEQHRTFQQDFTRLCVGWLIRCKQLHEKGLYDERNEASCKLGVKFVQQIDELDRILPRI
jgi:hypothetical protein